MDPCGTNGDVVLQVTFFAAIVVLDTKRQQARKLDVLLWVTSSAEEPSGYCCGVFGGGTHKPCAPHTCLSFLMLL